MHGPSEVVGSKYPWTDDEWKNIPLREYVIYELHVGTFSPEGTFEAVIPHLDTLKELGISAIEIMPVAQFPGDRNWGYDGVALYAPQNSYGGPAGLRKLVDACHARRLAVILDVVYNHLGPEGNYLPAYAPYFTDKYRTPWGDALNFDGPDSGEVRRFFIENALYWLTEFHFDALRLDAVHAINDASAKPFLHDLTDAAHARGEELGVPKYLIAESDLNDPRLLRTPEAGGFGLDAQWSDDFHHAVHTLLTGEKTGYYSEFGTIEQLARAYRETFIYADDYSPHRKRRHGAPVGELEYSRFVAFMQNHDQVGNRMLGDRLSKLVSWEQLKLAAVSYLLSPYIPMIFMGEEYGEEAPFLYFTSHTDQELVEAVRKGRKEEFSSFAWQGEAPDPHETSTFEDSRVDAGSGRGKLLWNFYRELIALRRLPAFSSFERGDLDVDLFSDRLSLVVHRRSGKERAFFAMNFSDREATIDLDLPKRAWKRILDSADATWDGPGSRAPEELGKKRSVIALAPHCAAVYEHS